MSQTQPKAGRKLGVGPAVWVYLEQGVRAGGDPSVGQITWLRGRCGVIKKEHSMLTPCVTYRDLHSGLKGP